MSRDKGKAIQEDSSIEEDCYYLNFGKYQKIDRGKAVQLYNSLQKDKAVQEDKNPKAKRDPYYWHQFLYDTPKATDEADYADPVYNNPPRARPPEAYLEEIARFKAQYGWDCKNDEPKKTPRFIPTEQDKAEDRFRERFFTKHHAKKRREEEKKEETEEDKQKVYSEYYKQFKDYWKRCQDGLNWEDDDDNPDNWLGLDDIETDIDVFRNKKN